MANRNDTDDVRAFYPHLPAAITDADPYINVANQMVNLHLSDQGYAEELLTQIELLLACHYIEVAVYRGGLKAYQIGESRETYNAPSSGTHFGLMATSYGQQAITLDSSGLLRDTNRAERPAQFNIIRTSPTN